MNADKVSHRLSEFLSTKVAASSKTQRQIADELDVSLPTCKRWLKGIGVDFQNVSMLADVLRFDFGELGTFLNQTTVTQFSYTERQELCLSENIELLVVFDMLHRGSTVGQIQKKLDASASGINRLLKELEDIKLIERMPHDRIRIIPHGEPTWKPNGPLKKALRNILVERVSTLAKKHAENVIALVQVNAADETELRRLSQEWIKFASESDNRARRLKKGDKQSFAVMAAMVPMALEDILN